MTVGRLFGRLPLSLNTMLTLHAITADEIDRFVAVATIGERRDSLKRSIQGYWDRDESCPSWCFIVEREGVPAGRVAYWSFPGSREHSMLMALGLPWGVEFFEPGRFLLEESARRMSAVGTRSIEYMLRSDRSEMIAEQRQLLEAADFLLVQQKLRFAIHGPPLEQGQPPRLTFRAAGDAGEEALHTAVRAVTTNTLDREHGTAVATSGPNAAAHQLIADLRDIDSSHPEWWQLAYDGDGELAGLIITQPIAPGRGTINYIGVVPDKRGKGYVDELIRKGVEMLADGSIDETVADIDVENFPMARALGRVGFLVESEMWVYRKELSSGASNL